MLCVLHPSLCSPSLIIVQLEDFAWNSDRYRVRILWRNRTLCASLGGPLLIRSLTIFLFPFLPTQEILCEVSGATLDKKVGAKAERLGNGDTVRLLCLNSDDKYYLVLCNGSSYDGKAAELKLFITRDCIKFGLNKGNMCYMWTSASQNETFAIAFRNPFAVWGFKDKCEKYQQEPALPAAYTYEGARDADAVVSE